LVQRDSATQSPVIHASSLKGGIKEYCHSIGLNDMKYVFGSEKKADGKTDHDNSQVGSYKFFDANILCIPVRCDSRAYIHITCPRIIMHIADSLPLNSSLVKSLKSLAGIITNNDTNNAYCFESSLNNAVIEDFEIKAAYKIEMSNLLTPELKDLFKHDIVITKDTVFDTLTNDLHLPVIARNYLENGESMNLWYEQVPRMSRFWSKCIFPVNDTLFKDKLFKVETLVQVGANGSIGYGYCSFAKI